MATHVLQQRLLLVSVAAIFFLVDSCGAQPDIWGYNCVVMYCPAGSSCPYSGGACSCGANQAGPVCKTATGDCSNSDCSPVGTVGGATPKCEAGSNKCICKDGYTGPKCDKQTLEVVCSPSSDTIQVIVRRYYMANNVALDGKLILAEFPSDFDSSQCVVDLDQDEVTLTAEGDGTGACTSFELQEDVDRIAILAKIQLFAAYPMGDGDDPVFQVECIRDLYNPEDVKPNIINLGNVEPYPIYSGNSLGSEAEMDVTLDDGSPAPFPLPTGAKIIVSISSYIDNRTAPWNETTTENPAESSNEISPDKPAEPFVLVKMRVSPTEDFEDARAIDIFHNGCVDTPHNELYRGPIKYISGNNPGVELPLKAFKLDTTGELYFKGLMCYAPLCVGGKMPLCSSNKELTSVYNEDSWAAITS